MRFSPIALSGLIMMAATASACMDRTLTESELDDSVEGWAEFEVEANRNLDILFVIDDSGSMANEQDSLAHNFTRLIEQIQSVEHGLPDLHIGVVSTDLGVGPHADTVGQCTAHGEMGLLQSAPPPGETCSVPADPYIIDVAGDQGERVRNYDSTLAETFSCIARLGDDGCGFEQPLEAMRRALDNAPANSGFLRPDARLAVIFVTDEDDCSTRDPAMFDRARDDLGPANGYRCFEYGVTCDVDDPRAPGAHPGCRPRQGSSYMHDIDEYVDFLRTLKTHPDRDILVAGIVGNSADPVMVGVDDNGLPTVLQSCFDSDTDQEGAFPPVRLQAFMQAFAFHQETSICNSDLADALARIGEFIGPPPEGACLPALLLDTDPSAPDVQPLCVVSEIRDPDTPAQTEALLPACDDPADPAASSQVPCYTLSQRPETCGDSLWIDAHYPPGQVVPPATVIRARCQAR